MVSPVIQSHNHYEDKGKLCCFCRPDSTTTRRNHRASILLRCRKNSNNIVTKTIGGVLITILLLYFVTTWWWWWWQQQQFDVSEHEHHYQERHFWKPVKHRSWCRPSSSQIKQTDDGGGDGKPGLIYIKIDKSASSTLAGINIRISREIGSEVLGRNTWWRRWWSSSSSNDGDAADAVCSHTYMHRTASKALASQADTYRKAGQTRRQSSRTTTTDQTTTSSQFLAWTFVRDPFQRSLSEYYHFYISRLGNNSTQTSLQKFLKAKKNFQLLYTLDVDDPTKEIWDVLGTGPGQVDRGSNNDIFVNEDGSGSDNRKRYISEGMKKLIQNHIFESYDFVGVVERMEESLAVMKLLWGLPLSSLIVLSAKKSGGYDDGRFNDTCYRIQPQSLPSSTVSSTKSNFVDDNYDYLLYDMINTSLDNTIEMLGRGIVHETRSIIRFWQRKAENECQQEAIFPCSKDGKPQHRRSFNDCYWFDSGCGYKCVDNIMLTLKGS
mmetsp:Transcript_10759/g.25634  ORF Transcript_10759/g.25634 Transcript_10759/m.25634 type:complete len:493 (+) Transcript_10759:54-1532(+)